MYDIEIGLNLSTFYIFIVIHFSVTESTIIFSTGNSFYWAYEIEIDSQGQKYAYSALALYLQCVTMEMYTYFTYYTRLYSFYDFNLIRGALFYLFIYLFLPCS